MYPHRPSGLVPVTLFQMYDGRFTRSDRTESSIFSGEVVSKGRRHAIEREKLVAGIAQQIAQPLICIQPVVGRRQYADADARVTQRNEERVAERR
jgi:hypothetical protein